jgi:molybdate transport system substrate-binding protein
LNRCVAGLVFVLGCWTAPPAGDAPLYVSVAISLRPALEEAIAEYCSGGERPDVLLNSGGSAVLLQQIRHGAPADLMISASSDEIDRLVDEGLAVAATRRRLASNRLVVVVPLGAPVPSSVNDLAGAGFDLVVVANPRTSPLGRYTRQALGALELWDRLEPRTVQAENARYALDYVARGEVAAGVVYVTDAHLRGDRVSRGPEIAVWLHDPIGYEGVVLQGTSRSKAAAALLEWLSSPVAQSVLDRHGFAPP